jgi:tetratricopeptide (TPR) repeat protein
MTKQLSRLTICTAFAGIVAAGAAGAPEGKKQFRDRQEYTLYDSVTKATDANQKLALLNTWNEKYPDSDFKLDRLQLFLTTYEQLGVPAKMIDAAKEILAVNPKDITALYWITFLTRTLGSASQDELDAAGRAANGLLAAEKPAGVRDEAWTKAKSQTDAVAYTTLGWIAMQRKSNELAEQNFKKSLTISPNAGQISYWLGTVILAENKPEKQSEALFDFARAAAYDGTGALAPERRQEIDVYLTKVYNRLHGDSSGLAELKATAMANPTPSADFKIKTAAEVAAEKEEALTPYYAEMAKLPILNGGSSVAFVAADRKCAEQFQQVFSMEGLEKRKRLAELVQYKCGLVVDTPVHLAKLSVEAVEAIQHKAAYISVTIVEGESKGKSGWVPAEWVANY